MSFSTRDRVAGEPFPCGKWGWRVQAAVILVLNLTFAAAACAQTPRQYKLVVLGDSLTAGYGLAPNQAFPRMLQAALEAKGWKVSVVNAGVSGDTASDGLARLDWSVGAAADGVIVELGANDMLRGIDPATTRKALGAILEKLHRRNIPAMLAGMYASPTLGRAYVSDFQSIYPDLAKIYRVPLYPFFLEGVADVPSLEQADGMHPNAQGVKRIVASILPSVESFLDAIAARRRG